MVWVIVMVEDILNMGYEILLGGGCVGKVWRVGDERCLKQAIRCDAMVL